MDFRKDIRSESSGNLFLRIKDNESVKGYLVGKIHDYYAKFQENRWHTTTKDDGGSFRFKVNIVIFEKKDERSVSEPIVKIWEGGVPIYNALADIDENLKEASDGKYGIEDYAIIVRRRGEGKNTKYTVTNAPTPLTESQKKAINDLQLHDLTGKKGSQKDSAPEGGDENWPSADDEIPF